MNSVSRLCDQIQLQGRLGPLFRTSPLAWTLAGGLHFLHFLQRLGILRIAYDELLYRVHGAAVDPLGQEIAHIYHLGVAPAAMIPADRHLIDHGQYAIMDDYLCQ